MSNLVKRIAGKLFWFGLLSFGIIQNNEMALNVIKFMIIISCLLSPVHFALTDEKKEESKARLVFGLKTNLLIGLAFACLLACGGMVGYAVFGMLGTLIMYAAIYSEKDIEEAKQ